MLFVHAQTPVENKLGRQLALFRQVTEWPVQDIQSCLQQQGAVMQEKILLYSFQDFGYYKHIDSYQHEVDQVSRLAAYCEEESFERIILLTYPGAYSGSGNLFLQHKGIIEQLFMNTGIPCILLNVQGIGDSISHLHNLHSMFFDAEDGTYIIPKKKACLVYSVQFQYLVSILLKCITEARSGKYDVFDTVFECAAFLRYYSPEKEVIAQAPLYLYFKSFLGTYAAPTMMELFLNYRVPMFKFRTSQAFDLPLEAEPQQAHPQAFKRFHSRVGTYNPVLKSIVPVQ